MDPFFDLGLPRLSGTALDLKSIEQLMFFKVFANAVFRYFEALDGPLGPILAPPGLLWSKMGPQNNPKTCPKHAQKLVQQMTPSMAPK